MINFTPAAGTPALVVSKQCLSATRSLHCSSETACLARPHGAPSAGHLFHTSKTPVTLTPALTEHHRVPWLSNSQEGLEGTFAAVGWGAVVTGGWPHARTSWLGCAWWRASSSAQLCGYQGLWRPGAAAYSTSRHAVSVLRAQAQAAGPAVPPNRQLSMTAAGPST